MPERTSMKKKPITSALQVRNSPPGIHGAGNGLYLVVNKPTDNNLKGARQWQFRFVSPITKKRREMGLGAAGEAGMSLAAANEKILELRRLIREGLDPIEVRDHEIADARARASQPHRTFGAFADKWIDDNLDDPTRNPKHVAQWRMTLGEYAKPLREKALDQITTQDVLAALRPIWNLKPETAKRTQNRIEKVLDAAKAAGLRYGDNPARWRGHLDHLLPARRKLSRGHHAALSYEALPAFIETLRQRAGIAALALEFLILTAARSGEVRGATWDEVDLEKRRWSIPAARMKAGKAHRVPLSDRAVEILNKMKAEHGEEGLVFPGAKGKGGKPVPMSDMTLAAVIKRMAEANTELVSVPDENDPGGRRVVTVHGFRSTFRDWAEDVAGFPHGAIEAALAHTIRNQTEAAYRRGDAYDRRVHIMNAWADFADSASHPENVVQLRA